MVHTGLEGTSKETLNGLFWTAIPTYKWCRSSKFFKYTGHLEVTGPSVKHHKSWFVCHHSNYEECPEVKIHHVQADREIVYVYYGNTAFDLDPLPVSRARLTVVEPALFEWDVFVTAAPIQSPAKCEVRSVIRFLNTKGERPAEIHKQIVAVYGNVMNKLVSSPKETSRWEKVRRRWWGARRSHDVVRRAGGTLLWLGDTEAGSKT